MRRRVTRFSRLVAILIGLTARPWNAKRMSDDRSALAPAMWPLKDLPFRPECQSMFWGAFCEKEKIWDLFSFIFRPSFTKLFYTFWTLYYLNIMFALCCSIIITQRKENLFIFIYLILKEYEKHILFRAIGIINFKMIKLLINLGDRFFVWIS